MPGPAAHYSCQIASLGEFFQVPLPDPLRLVPVRNPREADHRPATINASTEAGLNNCLARFESQKQIGARDSFFLL